MEFGAGIAVGGDDLLTRATSDASACLSTDADLTLVFATPDAAGALTQANGPGRTVGCIADGVIAGAHEEEEGPAVAVWQASFGDRAWSLSRIHAVRSGSETSIRGWRHPPGAHATMLLSDPASFPTQGFIEELGARDMPVIGGLATSSFGTQLMVDGEVQGTGAVAVSFGEGIDFSATVSQGCRPIGQPAVVTNARNRHIFEIGGHPAAEWLMGMIRELDEEDQGLARIGLQVGIVRDEYRESFDIGDFLIRPVLDLDADLKLVTVGAPVAVGQTIQFHVRDPQSAAAELETMLARVPPTARAGDLLFTCNGRGRRFFGRPHHDAEMIDRMRDPQALAGFFAAGEIGPVGGGNHLHGYTATLAELSPAD